MSKTVPKASREKAREEIELPATLDKESQTIHNSLSNADGHISPGCCEKNKACWLRWKIYHPRKRMRMLIDMLTYKKHEVKFGKNILVTTTIEVAISPAPPSPRSPIISSDEPYISLVDFASDEEREGQDSITLRPITAPSHSADAEAGAERGHKRRHSIPSSRPFSFHQLVHPATSPRSGFDGLGLEDHSILAREAKWAECLERATVMSARSSGLEELDEKGLELDRQERTRYKLGKSLLRRLRFGRRMRKAD